VAFGIASFSDPYELKMEGSALVRLFFSACPVSEGEDTPAIRRKAPRNVSVIFMMFLSLTESCGNSQCWCGSGTPARELYSPNKSLFQQKSPAATELFQLNLSITSFAYSGCHP
jgi:hypothetical protein